MSLETQINTKREQLRKIQRRIENPNWQEEQNAAARRRYAENPEPRLSQSKKWQKNNPDKVNAAARNYHAKNKDKINARLREKRKLKRIDTDSS